MYHCNNKTEYNPEMGIYFGPRGGNFKNFIKTILNKGGLRAKYINLLTSEDSMKIFSAVFTSESVDENENYQVYEQLGDLTGNKFIVWYMYRRFPQLKCTKGVKIAARLRINYGAKQSFSEIARKLGFWKFITATKDIRQRKMKPLLEDVFEAFIGAIECILDDKIRIGIGYAIVYKILEAIFNDIPISLNYDDLYDSKTRLKELFDKFENKLGPLVYKEDRDPINERIIISKVYIVKDGKYEVRNNGTINKQRVLGGEYIEIGSGSAALKTDAQQNASEKALLKLNSLGYSKPVPEIYNILNEDKDGGNIKITPEIIKARFPDEVCIENGVEVQVKGIDAMRHTKEKTKYQIRYKSTILSYYCRIRNYYGVKAALELGANPNIKDTDGMNCVDLVLMGPIDNMIKGKVGKILNLLMKYKTKMKINSEVYNNYYIKYDSAFQGKFLLTCEKKRKLKCAYCFSFPKSPLKT